MWLLLFDTSLRTSKLPQASRRLQSSSDKNSGTDLKAEALARSRVRVFAFRARCIAHCAHSDVLGRQTLSAAWRSSTDIATNAPRAATPDGISDLIPKNWEGSVEKGGLNYMTPKKKDAGA